MLISNEIWFLFSFLFKMRHVVIIIIIIINVCFQSEYPGHSMRRGTAEWLKACILGTDQQGSQSDSVLSAFLGLGFFSSKVDITVMARFARQLHWVVGRLICVPTPSRGCLGMRPTLASVGWVGRWPSLSRGRQSLAQVAGTKLILNKHVWGAYWLFSSETPRSSFWPRWDSSSSLYKNMWVPWLHQARVSEQRELPQNF